MFMEHEEQHHLLTNNVPNPDQTQQQPRSRLMLYLYDVPLLNSVFYDTDICLSLVVAVPFWFLGLVSPLILNSVVCFQIGLI